jgi:enamine deaminase RidA (YjgF/YER057c/UK114 family)
MTTQAHRPIQPLGWAPPRGYSNGMIGSGQLLAIAGQIAWDAQCNIVSDDVAAQFRQCLSNVLDIVRTAGGTPTDVVSLTIYVVDKHRYIAAAKEIGTIWRELFGRHYPAMALVQVAALLEDRAQVEISGLALVAPSPAS